MSKKKVSADGAHVTSKIEQFDANAPSFFANPGQRSGVSPTFLGGNVFATPQLTSGAKEVKAGRRQAVINARRVVQDSPLAEAAGFKRSANAVGAELRYQSTLNWRAMGLDMDRGRELKKLFAEQIEALWVPFSQDHRHMLDAHRQSEFGELMFRAAQSGYGPDGEALLIVRYDEERMQKHQAKYATYIELVDPDRLSTPTSVLNENLNKDGPMMQAGVELDEYGGAVAYWITKSHPSDGGKGTTEWARVPRETDWGRPVCIHWFMKNRPAVHRAMPPIISALRSYRDLDKLNDAELQAEVLDAMFTMYIESTMSATEILKKLETPETGAQSSIADVLDAKMAHYEKNAIMAGDVRVPVLAPDDKLHLSTSGRSRKNNDSLRKSHHRAQAAVQNLTYEMFSGDYSDTTFSSAQAALIDIWRLIMIDRTLFNNNVPKLVVVAFAEECVARGLIKLPNWAPDFFQNITAYTSCEFRGPGRGFINPDQEQKAAGGRTEKAMTSYTQEAASQGQDFETNIDSIAAEQEYARERGVVLPTMPEYHAMRKGPAAATSADPEDDAQEDPEQGNPKPKPTKEEDEE